MSRKFGEESPVTFQVQKTLPHIVLRQLGDVRNSCNHWRIRRKRQMKPATHDCELTIDRGVGCHFTASPRDVLLDATCRSRPHALRRKLEAGASSAGSAHRADSYAGFLCSRPRQPQTEFAF